MSNFFEDLWQWGLAVLTYWQAYATAGLVAVVLKILEHFGLPISKRLYISGAIAFLLVACFMTWREKHIAFQGSEKVVQALQEELQHEKTRKLPLLEGTIEQYYIEWIKMIDSKTQEIHRETFFIYAQLAIKNLGDPSIAKTFDSALESDDGILAGESSVIVDGKVISGAQNTTITLKSSDAIYEKSEISPIPTGGMTRGWINVAFPGEEYKRLIASPSATLAISFQDVRSRRYTAKISLKDRDKPYALKQFGGGPPVVIK